MNSLKDTLTLILGMLLGDRCIINCCVALVTAVGDLRACEVGLDDTCSANERCVSLGDHLRSRSGICKCRDGFQRTSVHGNVKCRPESKYLASVFDSYYVSRGD